MSVGPVCAGAAARLLVRDDARSFDVLGAVDLPLRVGTNSTIVVGAGAGGGWFSTIYTRGEAMLSSTSAGLRLDAHAAFAYQLTRYVSLHVGVSAGASPSAPTVIDDVGDQPLTNDEPRGFFRGDAGLRIGVP